MNRSTTVAVLALLSGISFTSTSIAENPSSSASLFPASTIVYAELHDPDDLVTTIFDHPLRKRIEALPPYKMATETPDFERFQTTRLFIESHFGKTWREAIATYAKHGIAIGMDTAEKNSVAMVIHGADADSMTHFRDKLVALAKFGMNADEIYTHQYRDVEVTEINKAKFAVVEDRMVVTLANKIGQAVLDRMIDGEGDSLADNERYQRALAEQENAKTAWAFFDVQAVRETEQGKGIYKKQIDNPALELLVGGIQSTLNKTPYMTASTNIDASGLQFAISMPHQSSWVPTVREYYFGPDGKGHGPEVAEVDETLFSLSTYRDFSEMWLQAGDLFSERINDQFAQADANLSTLFAGRDFGEDILGSVHPEVGFIAARQEFEGILPRPTIKLPSFALVMRLREPETMTRELRRTFQSVVGFLNVIGAMNGQNQLELDMEKLEDDIELVSSTFVPEEDDRESTQAPIIFNFSPTVAFDGGRFVVSSTKTLAKDLVSVKPSSQSIEKNSEAVLNASVLRDVLNDNRGQLIAQNMLEDGNTREEAEAVIDLVLEVVGYFKEMSFDLATTDDRLDIGLAVRVQGE